MIVSALELPEKELKELISAYFIRQAKEWARLKRKYHEIAESKENLEINIFIFSLIPDIADLYLEFILGKITERDLLKGLNLPIKKLLREKNPSLGEEDIRKAFLSKSLYAFTIFEFNQSREGVIEFFNRALRFVRPRMCPATAFKSDKTYDFFLRTEVELAEYREKLETILTKLSVKMAAHIVLEGEKGLEGSSGTSAKITNPEEFSKKMGAWHEAINSRVLEVYCPRYK